MSFQDHLDGALAAYERATFGGATDAIAVGEAHLDHAEAALALARGRLAHARFLATREPDPEERVHFQRAVDLSVTVGDTRTEGEATFWLAVFHQVVEGDHGEAAPLLRRADELASEAGDDLTRSYVLRHLCFVAQDRGELADAEALLGESTALRRGLGHVAGVAANLVGLAYLAAGRGATDDARAHLAEADELATGVGAAGVLRWVDGARDDLGLSAG